MGVCRFIYFDGYKFKVVRVGNHGGMKDYLKFHPDSIEIKLEANIDGLCKIMPIPDDPNITLAEYKATYLKKPLLT